MRGHSSLRLICAAGGALAVSFVPLFAAPVLTSEGSSVTSYLGGTSTLQKTKPRFDQRGSDLEGGARLNGAPGPVAVAPSSGYAAMLVGGIDLATLTWAQCDVDFALPTDGPSVVIGRTFNHRQGGVKGVAAHSPQGYNWFQSAMPEIVSTKSGSASANDRVYVMLGAGKYLEYKRVSAVSSDFIGVNGASGVVVEKLSTYDTYELTDAAGTVWTFWGGNTAGKADWQLWKKTDAAGRSVYVGDKTTPATAISNGYANGAVIEMYQEYGTGSDLRRYKFTYGQTISSVDHLTEVLVELNTGGSWTSPTEVGRVTYHYYTAATANATDTSDFYGNAGDLEYVRVRVPLSDSGVYDERTKYFRYYEGHAYSSGGSTLNDYAHTLKMVMGHEGTRRADIADGGAADSYMGVGNGVSTAEETATLKQYSDAFFTYETGNVDETIASAFFNGECGCAAGSSTGTYTFTKVVNSKYATNVANTKYDSDWVTRTVVANPDGSYQTHYFDEVGQPVAAVLSDIIPTSATNFWVTGIDRDSDGRVTTVHSPANVTGYTHDTGGSPDGTITYSTSAGLVMLYDRYNSGSEPGTNDTDFNGIASGTRFRTGTTSGSAAYLNKSVFSKRSLVVGASSVVRPMVTEARSFFAASTSHSPGTPANYYNATGYAYAWWNTVTMTDPLYITPKSVTTTLPTVTSGNNGSGSADTTVSYLRKDGRVAISVAADGIYTAVKYNNLGQSLRTVRDADPSVSGDFDTGYGPSNFGLSTLSNGGLKYASEVAYDKQGRTVTTTAHAGSSPRVSFTHYGKLTDGRLTTITAPLYSSGTPSWTGPFSYTVSNQGGRNEFTATLGPSLAVTTASSSWISASSDPIDALHSSLSGTNRAYVRNVSTVIYDTPGVKVSEQRKYLTTLPNSGSWTGTAGTDYDKTTYGYDSMGRPVRTVDPTGTIDRVVFDAVGRPRAMWTGTSDTNWAPSGNGSGDNMTQTLAMAYDGATIGTGLAVGNSLVTRREVYVKEDATAANGTGDLATARVSTMYFDVRGNLIATRNPQAPHTVNAYDLMRRVTATASYNATGGVDASVNPLTDDTLASGATIRLGANQTFYDEQGHIYKTTLFKVNQTTGADTDSLDSLTWYDSVGRMIKTGGISLTKMFYDRLGRPTHKFTLARCNDSSYTDADDVTGDIVLEEIQTVFDDADQTGNVVLSAAIIRNQDDTTTTGALDTNADGNRYKLTAVNLAGRVQITASWYDSLDRMTDSVAYGTNGGSDFDRRPSGSWLSVPSRGGTPLRTTSVFDAWGRVESVEQPRVRTGTTGYSTKYEFDHASRKVTEIRNYTGGSTSTAARDNDVYTRFVYTNGLMTRMWVDLNGDNTVNTTDQATDYVFGVVKTGSGSTPPVSQVASNRLLVRATYPEQTSGQSTSDKSEYFAYNAQNQKITARDQNGTVHGYTFDTTGRQTIDAATTTGTSIDLGSGGSNIDTAVLRVETAYDGRGFVSTVTQYNATSSGSVVDQVQNTYDDWGNLKVLQQDYNGTVASSSGDDLGVEYTWSKVDDTSTTSGNVRRSGLRITGTKLQRSGGATTVQDTRFTYSNSSSYDDDIGRVTSITDSAGSTTLAEYRYGGVGMVVRTTLSQPGITDELTTTGTGGYNTYLDDFGRVIRNRWRNTTSGAVWYDSKPSYDANSSITGVENAWVTPWSASYGVDGLDRLDGATTGTLSGGSISNANTWRKETWRDGSGNLKISQTGNWGAYTAYVGDPSVSGNDEFSQTRTHTLRNEVSGVTESSSWVGGVYSYLPRDARNGSVTRDDTNTAQFGFRYFYDAWNRVVKVTNFLNNATIAEYRYNGLGHRIGWKAQFDTGQTYANNKWRYFQYNEKWQQVAMYQGTTASNGACGSNAMETYLYHGAGLDGRGGSSYIDKVVFRDRDVNGFASSGTGDGTREERNYYLQNWRNDVVALVTDNGKILERYRYDAYGRPSSFSPADLTGISGGPSGTISGADSTRFYATWSVGGAVTWETDLSDGAAVTGPDGAADNGDAIAFNAYYFASYTGGYGQISDDAIDNRKGLGGYEFDPILNGNGSVSGASVPLYHVRNRMLNSYTGKWMQKDPLGYADGMDLYEYCRSDAVDRIDSYGEESKSCVAVTTLAATVIVAETEVQPALPSPVPPALAPIPGCDLSGWWQRLKCAGAVALLLLQSAKLIASFATCTGFNVLCICNIVTSFCSVVSGALNAWKQCCGDTSSWPEWLREVVPWLQVGCAIAGGLCDGIKNILCKYLNLPKFFCPKAPIPNPPPLGGWPLSDPRLRSGIALPAARACGTCGGASW